MGDKAITHKTSPSPFGKAVIAIKEATFGVQHDKGLQEHPSKGTMIERSYGDAHLGIGGAYHHHDLAQGEHHAL